MPCRKQEGFTLVEVLIAMIILAVGLVAVANLLVAAKMSNLVANGSTMATARATEQMERLISMPMGGSSAGIQLTPGGDGAFDDDIAGFFEEQKLSREGAFIRVRWWVSDVTPAGTGPTTYHIRVRSMAVGPLMGQRTLSEFTTIRVQSPAE